MFSDVNVVVTWIFSEITKFAQFLWDDCAWVGALIIALPLLRRLINIFRRILS